MKQLTMDLGDLWVDLPVEAENDDGPTPTATLGILGENGPVVTVDLLVFEAQGEEAETLPALITVGKNERGPHEPDTVQLASGLTAHRSLGSFPSDPAAPQSPAVYLCCHAVRMGDVDVVARTWLGLSPNLLPALIDPIEELLDSITVEDGVS